MKKLVFIFLCALIVVSCSNNAAPKPDKMLSEDDMVNILYDIALLQAIKSFTPKSLNDNNIKTQTYIFNKYKTDSLSFAQNHLYYASDLKKYDKMQKKVFDRLKKAKAKLEVKPPKKATTTKPDAAKTTAAVTPANPNTPLPTEEDLAKKQAQAKIDAIRASQRARKVHGGKASGR